MLPLLLPKRPHSRVDLQQSKRLQQPVSEWEVSGRAFTRGSL
jgi:hypothetical protein